MSKRVIQKMRKRILMFFILLILLIVAGCSGKEDSSSLDLVPTNNKMEDIEETEEVPVYPAIEPDSEHEIRIRTDISDEYRDVTLAVGEYVDIPHRQGYTFHGYQDDKNGGGVTYIDEKGQYINEYHGTELLVLWPVYTANEYRITICEEGKPLECINDFICDYDEALNGLPWENVIVRDGADKSDKNSVIIGFTAGDGQLTLESKDKSVTVKKLEEYANHQENTLSLNVLTTDIEYSWSCLNTRRVSNDGLLKQTFETKGEGYDVFSLNEDIDIEALKNIGYKEVKVDLTMCSLQGDGIPRIVVTSQEAIKNKDIKKYTLIDTDKIKEDVQTKEYFNSYLIPIDDLTGDFYVYYNCETIGNKTWDCSSITIEFEFLK